MLKFWGGTLLLAPVWWITGANLLVYQTAAFLMFFILMFDSFWREKGVFLPPSFFAVLFIIAACFFSLLIHAPSYPFSRVLASLYNLSFWAAGACLIAVTSQNYWENGPRVFLKTLARLGAFMGLLAAMALGIMLTGETSLAFPTPLARMSQAFQGADLIEQTLTIRLLFQDWFHSAMRPRFNALSPYSNATAGILILMIIAVISKIRAEKEYQNPFLLLILFSNIGGLLMTLSRMSIVALVLGGLAVFCLQRKKFIFIFALFAATLLLGPLIGKGLGFLLGLRQESSVSRFELYGQSLAQLQGADWVLGLGLKDRAENPIFPLGSHSTFVSLMIRGGGIAFLGYLVFQAGLLQRWYSLGSAMEEKQEVFYIWIGFGWMMLSMLFWTLLEDVDAPQLLAYLYFSAIGFFEGMHKKIRSQRVLSPRPA